MFSDCEYQQLDWLYYDAGDVITMAHCNLVCIMGVFVCVVSVMLLNQR